MSDVTDLKCCPKCDSTDGVYRKVSMSGKTHYFYAFKGMEEADNSELHNSLSYKESVFIYCVACDARIGKAKPEQTPAS